MFTIFKDLYDSTVCLLFFSITGIPPTTTTSTTTPKTLQIEQETRAPKALKGWFENPYLIKQQPNFEAFIEASRNSAIHNMSKKLETNHSISDEPGAFFSGMLMISKIEIPTFIILLVL